jgi:two-component system, OmpR family, response regulator
MKKVLIVDDKKNIRHLLSTCLETEGFKVFSVNDGQQALNLIEFQLFDLVFLDIKLPIVSGTEVLRRMRGEGITTPVIVMTAFAYVKNAVECTRLGAITYLEKPFTTEKIRKILNENITCQSKRESMATYLNPSKELLKNGKSIEAFNLVKNALAIEPSCGEAYSIIAQVYEIQGDTVNAKRFSEVAKICENMEFN